MLDSTVVCRRALGCEWGVTRGNKREQLSRLNGGASPACFQGGAKGRPPPWTPPGHQSSPLFICPRAPRGHLTGSRLAAVEPVDMMPSRLSSKRPSRGLGVFDAIDNLEELIRI